MTSTATRLTYAATQTARVAFYGAHYLAARIMARDAFAAIEKPAHSVPSLGAMLNSMRALLAQDWRNVEAGVYPMPLDLAEETRRATTSLRYLADIPRVADRRRRRGHSDVAKKGEALPRYYRQNFHFQTDGYLSAESASLYDFQVEALFAGTADAMRRRAFVPIARFLEGRDPARTTLLDLGAGTGRFLSFVKSVHPALRAVALDLSTHYLERVRRNLHDHRPIECVVGFAETMPLRDASADVLTAIYLFHELPPKIRALVAREIARVLKPGGLFVLADTIQFGDVPAFDGLLDIFPTLLHEPYFAGFAKCDLEKLFFDVGLKRVQSDIAHLTKIVTFEKPGGRRRRPKIK
jgi:ubiquinone/menaquinone biosynthesis C-methylase UbiE